MILSIRSEFYQIGTLHYSLEGVVALLTTVFRVVLSLDEGVSKTHKQNITFVAFNFSEMFITSSGHLYNVVHLPSRVSKLVAIFIESNQTFFFFFLAEGL